MRSLMLRWALYAVFCSCFAGVLAATSPAADAVTIDWVTVGDPGNAADDTGYGAVDYVYRISKYETTNAQYAEFLYAVADDSDTFGLYNTSMATSTYGGITQSGSPESFTYTVKSGMGSKPVNYVSFFDSLRFANWLHNGRPTGAQGNATTEDGAYTSMGAHPFLGPDRNPDATFFLPSEDEWYKAAYYDAVSTSYFDYPAGTDTPTVCTVPGAMPNTANCYEVVDDLTDVGSYMGSASPSGTFDQGGNLWEWNEAILFGRYRGLRGGSSFDGSNNFAAWNRNYNYPTDEISDIGFRVAMIPEPATVLLFAGGLAGLALRRRLSA